ncbi:MAG: DUF4368 domain-containing protein [Oscillospiraceae bacterium]
MREINNRLELSEASAALVAIPRGNFTANFDILNELIEKIVVHEKVVDEDGGKSQQIDIYYKYVGDVNLKKAYYTAEDREWQAQAMALPETTAEK